VTDTILVILAATSEMIPTHFNLPAHAHLLPPPTSPPLYYAQMFAGKHAAGAPQAVPHEKILGFLTVEWANIQILFGCLCHQ
jgi:hypothetical protein